LKLLTVLTRVHDSHTDFVVTVHYKVTQCFLLWWQWKPGEKMDIKITMALS